jgi:hypothetical protein
LCPGLQKNGILGDSVQRRKDRTVRESREE